MSGDKKTRSVQRPVVKAISAMVRALEGLKRDEQRNALGCVALEMGFELQPPDPIPPLPTA